MENFLESVKKVYGFAASADRFNATPVSDAINLTLFREAVLALIVTPGASTGTATITVEACTSAAGAGATAVAFESQFVDAAGDPVDGITDRTARAAAGFATAAGTAGIYFIHVEPEAVAAVGSFVRVKLTEVVNDPVPGAGIWLVGEGRFGVLPTAVS